MRISLSNVYVFLISFISLTACKKDAKVISDNTAPYYDGIPTVKIENYVNKLFIDLIGREAFDDELSSESSFLKANNLSAAAREQLITKLQTDKTYRPGDSSYCYSYYNRFYDLTKVRLLEGATDADFYYFNGIINLGIIQDSLNGDSLSFRLKKEEYNKNVKALNAKTYYMNDSIEINEYYYALIYNSPYDQINMNSFNFIRATFNDLFFRYPSTSEFNNAYDMVEYNKPNILFGSSGQTKSNYLHILVNSKEFHEGIIRWLHQTFLSRNATSEEISTILKTFYLDRNVQKVQLNILKSDEYANF